MGTVQTPAQPRGASDSRTPPGRRVRHTVRAWDMPVHCAVAMQMETRGVSVRATHQQQRHLYDIRCIRQRLRCQHRLHIGTRRCAGCTPRSEVWQRPCGRAAIALTSAFACGHAQLIASHCLATYRARPWDAQPPHIAWPSTVLVCDTAGTQPHGGAEGLRGVLGATPTLTAAHVALSRQSGAMPRRGVDHGVLDGDAARCGREFRAGATGGRRDCHDSWPARGAMPGYTSLALRR